MNRPSCCPLLRNLQVSLASETLHNGAWRHAAAGAQGDESCREVTPFEFIKQGSYQNCTCSADGVTQGNRAADGVHFSVLHIHLTHELEGNDSKRLIDLDEINIAYCHARRSQRFTSRRCGRIQHQLWRVTRRRNCADSRARLEPVRLGIRRRSNHHRGGSIDNTRRIPAVVDVGYPYVAVVSLQQLPIREAVRIESEV